MDINLSLKRGQVVAIMGGSGSGKTTLLHLLAGLLRPAAGDIWFQGKNLPTLNRQNLYAARRNMGMLFQFGALFTDLSVFDNVAFPMREHYHLPETLVRDLVLLKLEAVGLRGTANMMPHQLSGGMARRIALARAMALDPQLMLYDEPFTGLDPISLATIADLIRELNDALGAASIIVTHNIAESLPIVDYVYVMHQGRIIGEGSPEDIQNSTDPYIAQFIAGKSDGPVPFHYPTEPLAQSLNLQTESPA